jgi:hypothetical protein
MAKTLLQVVQEVLESIDGDEVNSISDTLEASSVAGIVAACFETLITTKELRETQYPFTLTAYGATKPVLMERPDDIITVDWIKYDIREDGDPYPTWREIEYLPLKGFLEFTQVLPGELDTDAFGSFVQNINGSNITLYYRKDTQPRFYTTIDDKLILFDAYDSSVESSLQESKTNCFGQFSIEFNKVDGFVIPFDRKTTHQLVEDAKARASIELRQTQNPAAERTARRLHVRSQFDNRQVGPADTYAQRTGYGRK